MTHSNAAVTLSIRITQQARHQLEQLAHATGRTKSFLAAEAVDHYLSIQAWQVTGIKQALKRADSREAKFFEHNQVVEWLNSWGGINEKEPPK